LVYVSRFEGFGLPLLEAMHAETALISSNTSSMPEVAGEAALYVNPESVGEIQAAISRLAEDDALRSALIEMGRKQRKKFSWDQTAQACLEAILRVS
jgi:glycosyltransferase involved in cell wall biosynthesis